MKMFEDALHKRVGKTAFLTLLAGEDVANEKVYIESVGMDVVTIRDNKDDLMVTHWLKKNIIAVSYEDE